MTFSRPHAEPWQRTRSTDAPYAQARRLRQTHFDRAGMREKKPKATAAGMQMPSSSP